MSETDYNTDKENWQRVSYAFLALFVFTLILTLHLKETTYTKETLAIRGLGYYTNDALGQPIFQLKEVK